MIDAEHRTVNRYVLFWVVVGISLVAISVILWPFLGAVLWATVLSILTWPICKRWEPRFGRQLSALAVTTITASILVLPFAAVATVVGIQVTTFSARLIEGDKTSGRHVTIEQIADEIDASIKPVMTRLQFEDVTVRGWLDSNRDQLVSKVGQPVWQASLKLFATILTLVIGLLTMFFMLRDGDRLLEPIVELVPLPRSETVRILTRMQNTVHAVFVGVVFVSLIQSTIAGVAYWAVGVEGPLVWSLVTFAFCMIPLLGSPIVYVPLSLKLFAEGKITQGLALLAVGFLVISQIDNILRPFFIGARAGLHPMAVFFSLLGGVITLGPIGIMAGPMLLTLLLGLVEVLRTTHQLDQAEAPA